MGKPSARTAGRRSHFPAVARWMIAAALVSTVVFSPVRLMTIIVNADLDHSWNEKIGYGHLLDFSSSIVLTIAAVAVALWPILRMGAASRPAYAQIIMRVIDVLWYAGTTLAAMIAVAEFQRAVVAPSYEQASQEHALVLAEFEARKAEILAICVGGGAGWPSGTTSGSSSREAGLLARFCEAHRDWKGQGDDLFLTFPAEGTCADFTARPHEPEATEPRPEPASTQVPSAPDPQRSVGIIRNLCELDLQLHENRRELVVLRAAIDVGSSVSGTDELQSYFRFVAILIGLRLFRALFELADEIRLARRPH